MRLMNNYPIIQLKNLKDASEDIYIKLSLFAVHLL